MPREIRDEFERKRKSLRIRVLRVMGMALLIESFAVLFITKNPLWMFILFVLAGIVMLPVGDVATMMYSGRTRAFYWVGVAFFVLFALGLVLVAILYWPGFFRAIGHHFFVICRSSLRLFATCASSRTGRRLQGVGHTNIQLKIV